MSEHLTSYYMALQSERARLDRRAAEQWRVSSALAPRTRQRSITAVITTVAGGLLELVGATAGSTRNGSRLPRAVEAGRPC